VATYIRQQGLLAGLLLALVLLASVTWMEWRQFDRVERASIQLTNTHDVLTRLGRVLSLVQDIEPGAGGLVVTARTQVDAELKAVCEAINNNPRQRADCQVLAPLITRRIALSQETSAPGDGTTVMDELRGVIARMNAEEQRQLAERTADAARVARASSRQINMATGVAVLLIVGTFTLLLRENRLRQRSQLQLDRFFTLSLDMLCIANVNGYFTRVSPSFTHTLGHSAEALLARPIMDFVHPDDRTATEAEMARLRRGDPAISFENRYQCRDGSWRWLAWKAQPVPGEDVLYATARDITERKEAELQIRQLNVDLELRAAELDATNKELESFSYSVSHDLRAPLRSIDGFSQILLEDCADSLNAEGKDALHRVRRAARTMGELIDALLALSRVTRADLHAETVDLSQLATAIAADLQQSHPDRPVEFNIAPGVVAQADKALIRAALANLMENAWKYSGRTERACIEFGTCTRDEERAFFVRDNGAGFDMAHASLLFGAFQRLHRQSEFSGTGIGLATVQRIIHRHRGRVWAEGKVNEGATFYFTLPDGR